MNGTLNESTVVEEYDFIEPDVHEIEFLVNDINKDCRNKYFHIFEYRLVYDNKLTHLSNNQEVIFTIFLRPMIFKTEFYGLNKKIKNTRRISLIFN